jgi:hypothetical protein
MPRNNKGFHPETFDFGPPRAMGMRPGVNPDWLFGYYEFE